MAIVWRAVPLDLVVLGCLEQEREAWDELYNRTKPAQVFYIQGLLLRYGIHDGNEVEQIRAEVFASLLDGNGGHLRAFKEGQVAQGLCPLEQGALDRFLARLARNLIRTQTGAEERRKGRELQAALRRLPEFLRGIEGDFANPDAYRASLADLFERSSAADREALAHYLGQEAVGEAGGISAAALRQRSRRVRQRVQELFGP